MVSREIEKISFRHPHTYVGIGFAARKRTARLESVS
jgi:hypothetical protein